MGDSGIGGGAEFYPPNRLKMKLTKFLLLACAAFVSVSGVALADDATLAPRQVPAKTVPVPSDVSPGLQKLIAAPYNPAWNDLWTTGDEWRKAADAQAAGVMKAIPPCRIAWA